MTIIEEAERRMIGAMAKEIRVTVRSFPETAPEIRELLQGSAEIINAEDGFSYLCSDGMVYSCRTSPEGTELLAAIAPAGTTEITFNNEENTLCDVIQGKVDATQLRSFGFREGTKRCVILFRLSQPTDAGTLRGLIPLEESDRIVVLENGDAVLLINMNGRTPEEVIEFAYAAAETLGSEAGLTCFAGIGRPAYTLQDIAAGFRDAEEALATGLRHRIPGNVFVYGRHTLERFADMIPEEKAEKLKKEIIPDEAEKVLTEETLETIRVFFRNDLNLSTSARQLFIHRNTLIYRMEKIRKATGLDLRKFEDAAVFRILMSIPDKQA